MKKIIYLLLVVTSLISACTQAEAAPTITPIPTQTQRVVIEPTLIVRTPSPELTQQLSTLTTANNDKKLELYSTTVGVNLTGGEFGEEPNQFPGMLGVDYYYPDCTLLRSWAERGVTLFRLPFLLERVYEAKIDGDFEVYLEDLQEIENVLDCAAANSSYVVLDMHNYMRVYQDLVIGVDYPLEHWYQAWKILVLRYKDHPALAGYGIMGEPYELPYSYTEVAQNAINSIRFIDQTTPIVVSGDCWSSIGPEWNDCNAPLLQLIDPSNRLIVDGHLFLDPDGSGRYDCLTPIECGVLSGVDKVSQFVSWCSIHQMRCWVGSFGVPMRVGNWENITFQVVEYVLKHDIGIAFWGGGDVEWWGDYLLLIEGVEWLYPVFQR